jgi:transcription elongation factor GreB
MKHYLTPQGFERLYQELQHLLSVARPEVVQMVSWAASNGDRSENGDYLYGKKRLREIDRRVHYLTKRLELVSVVDPRKQENKDQIFFGATVVIEDDDKVQQVTIVGEDEADPLNGLVSVHSPIARALTGKRVGDEIEFRSPQGVRFLFVQEITYPS